MNSLDPRMARIGLDPAGTIDAIQDGGMWQSYEVFHQGKRGAKHEHVGSLKAADPETALILAKEQYGRRMKCVNLWVVRTADVFVFDMGDEDIFERNAEKTHREAIEYKVRDRIEAFKAAQ